MIFVEFIIRWIVFVVGIIGIFMFNLFKWWEKVLWFGIGNFSFIRENIDFKKFLVWCFVKLNKVESVVINLIVILL